MKYEYSPDRSSSRREPVIFNAVLVPNCSASIGNLHTAVLVFAAASVPVSIFFWVLGAWPVLGFVGLDFILLFAALRFHHWAGREKETISLTESSLTIRHINCWGKAREWSFSPYWLQVNLEELDKSRNRLEIRNREQSLIVGNRLSVQEKTELCQSLRDCLDRLSVWSRSPV